MIKQSVGGVSGKSVRSRSRLVGRTRGHRRCSRRGIAPAPRVRFGKPRGARVACENPGRVSLGACRSLGTPRVGRRAWRIIRGCF